MSSAAGCLFNVGRWGSGGGGGHFADEVCVLFFQTVSI